MGDRFFDAKYCDRCGSELRSRTMSWFTDATICMDCKLSEDAVRKQLPSNGKDYEGCGYIPEVKEC